MPKSVKIHILIFDCSRFDLPIVAGSKIDYVVNTSASLSRKVKAVEGTVFCSGETGFSLISADKKELCLYMINKEGKVLHTVRQAR